MRNSRWSWCVLMALLVAFLPSIALADATPCSVAQEWEPPGTGGAAILDTGRSLENNTWSSAADIAYVRSCDDDIFALGAKALWCNYNAGGNDCPGPGTIPDCDEVGTNVGKVDDGVELFACAHDTGLGKIIIDFTVGFSSESGDAADLYLGVTEEASDPLIIEDETWALDLTPQSADEVDCTNIEITLDDGATQLYFIQVSIVPEGEGGGSYPEPDWYRDEGETENYWLKVVNGGLAGYDAILYDDHPSGGGSGQSIECGRE